MRPLVSARGCGPATLLLAAVSVAAVLWALPACSVPTDAEFFPAAQDPPFTVTAVAFPQPQEQPQPINPTITVALSDFPDPATAQFPAVQLGRRGQAIEFLLELSLASKQLVLRPRRQLLPENDYFVSLSKEVQALSGRALEPPLSVRFRTGNFVVPAPAPEAEVALGQLLSGPAGLGARCAQPGCHSATGGSGGPAQGLAFDWGEAQLASYLTTRRARGSFEGLLLVQPGAPERSYLVRKLIASGGFARIAGAPMPPTGAPPMPPSIDASLLRALELWIRQGAH